MFKITDYKVLLKTKQSKRHKINKVNILIEESYLYNDMFNMYINLKTIRLHSFNIKRINGNIFNNLTNLRNIYLHFPYVLKYSSDFCKDLTLDILEIKCGIVDFNSFYLAKNIKSLNLIDTNIISIKFTNNSIIENIFIDGGKLIEFICINTNIKTLIINHTKLSIIILNDLPLLEVIDLKSNKLDKIKYFDNLILLRKLELSDNYIKDIIPLNMFNNLNYLSLNNNNIEDITFLNDCENMIELYINSNKIINPIFNNLFWVEKISINNNVIQHITDNMFGSTFNLRELDISDNCIVNISNNAFLYLDMLLNINLKNNPIKYIPVIKTFFDDSQNVHASSIQQNLISSIINLKNTCKCNKQFYKIFFNNNEILDILQNTEIHSCTGVSLIDVLDMVCERFFNDNSDINILKNMLLESKTSCFVGRISSIVFSRCGLDNDIIMNINKEEEIVIICANIQSNKNIIFKRKEFIDRTKNIFDNNLISKYLKYFDQ